MARHKFRCVCLQVAVALGTTVYLWNANTGDIEQLMECQEEDEYITSVSWGADGKHIAVGTSSATVQIWDANRVKQIRSLNGHAARVGALSWNNAILSSGGRDSIIVNHDVRYSLLSTVERPVCSNTILLSPHLQRTCGKLLGS